MFILEMWRISKTPVVQRNVLKTLAANALQISKSRLTLATSLGRGFTQTESYI